MECIFKTVTESDFEKICSFPESAEELFYLFPKATFPLTEEQLKSSVDNRTDSTVMVCDGEPIGFANFISSEMNEYCTIGNVILAPTFRGQGLGALLIRAMCRTAVEKYKVKRIRISCFNENTKGLLLYTKLGFTPSEIIQWVKPDGKKVGLLHLDRSV